MTARTGSNLLSEILWTLLDLEPSASAPLLKQAWLNPMHLKFIPIQSRSCSSIWNCAVAVAMKCVCVYACVCVSYVYIIHKYNNIHKSICIDYSHSNLRQRSRLICNIEHAIRCPSLLTSGSKASDWLCTERSWSGPKNRALVTRLCQNW